MLFAIRLIVDQAEYELALASCVTGVDNLCYVPAVHKSFNDLELLLLVAIDFTLKFPWDNG